MANEVEKTPRTTSICNKCNSKSYCANRDRGMMACINFNVFPAPERGEKAPWGTRH